MNGIYMCKRDGSSWVHAYCIVFLKRGIMCKKDSSYSKLQSLPFEAMVLFMCTERGSSSYSILQSLPL